MGILLLGASVALAGCSEPTGPEGCRTGAAIPLEEGSCLLFEEGGRLSEQRDEIEAVVRATLASVGDLIAVSGVGIRITAGPAYLIPEIGLGGRTNGTEEVVIAVDPEFADLDRTISEALFPLLAHELHHIARHREAGFSANLFEAMVMEGLADHFSIEVAGGDPPPWSVALTSEELEVWIEEAEEDWLAGPYNHDAWFFGASSEIPRWAGYSIGFDLVERYLEAHPSVRPSHLTGEAASTFLP